MDHCNGPPCLKPSLITLYSSIVHCNGPPCLTATIFAGAAETRRMKRKIKDISLNYEDGDGLVITVSTTDGGSHQYYGDDHLFTCWVGHHPHHHHHHPHHYDQHQCYDYGHLFTCWVGHHPGCSLFYIRRFYLPPVLPTTRR